MRLMSFYTADREVWKRRNKNALLDIHAAVRIDEPAHDDLFWPEVFQKPAEVHQRDVRIPVDHVHENQETWKLAHTVCGRYWYCCGWLLLPLSVVPILFVIGRGTETIGYTGVITVFLQLVPMLCALPVTEHALRKKFDKNGMRKS